tara:strand:- start:1152 stop:2369 length:1218 start_codon:yes stop_codon:yes gene_type:complete
MKKNTLYISYDGLTDPLGQSQILPYLTKISSKSHNIDIISFEKSESFKNTKELILEKIKNKNINWYFLKYTKNPPLLSTIFDLFKGTNLIKKLYQKNNYQIVHCRGYIAGLIGLKMNKKFDIPLIFDMRGWWPDEKLESGNWDNFIFKSVYYYFKRKEKELFNKSSKTISLTEIGRKQILKNKWSNEDKIGVIPTCVDFNNFPKFDLNTKINTRANLKISLKSQVLIYSGSLGGNYDFKDFAIVFKTFLKRNLDNQIIILSKTSINYLKIKLKEFKIDENRLRIISSPFKDVYKYLQASDIGLIIYKREFSTIGRSPTKLGEYWASGIPALSLKGIGDLESIISKYPHGGQLVNKLNEKELDKSFDALSKNNSKEKLRASAKEYYHIDKGVKFYSNIYNELLKEN